VTYASWRAIQALRAAPAGMADRDRQRRRTFTAALNQAEELAVAASAVTYAVRPLLLFYSLSQAGRAIAAAHLKAKAELSGHGLSFTCDPIAILKSTVVPPGTQHARGAFQDVATATGSLGLENPAELGALWAGNPDLQHVPVPETAGEWPRVLSCDLGTRSDSQRDTEVMTPGMVTSLLMLPGETGADLDRAIARYPTLAGARALLNEFEVHRPAGADELVGRVGSDGRGAVTVTRECPVQMTMPEYWQVQDELYSSVEIAEAFPRWPDPHLVGIVQPAIGGGPSPSPLMLWWALLLGLSSLVRYYPAVWVRAIDLDESILASPLRQVLDVAMERVPARVLDALRDRQV
jgi:hypothetical protein